VASQSKQDRDLHLPGEIQGKGYGKDGKGRYVTRYDPLMALEICEHVAGGATLTGKAGICNRGNKWGFCSADTFRRWLVNEPDMRKAYRAAREYSAHMLEEEALDMAREIRSDPGNAQRVRAFDVAMNQLRWSAGKRNPREYSERGSLTFTVPIQIVTPLNLGQEGATDSAAEQSVYNISAKIVEGEYEEVPSALDGSGERVFEPGPGKGKTRDKRKPRKDRKLSLGAIVAGAGEFTPEEREAAKVAWLEKRRKHAEYERAARIRRREAQEAKGEGDGKADAAECGGEGGEGGLDGRGGAGGVGAGEGGGAD
jgi:Bacteriophage Sf6, terminase small subunit-like